MWKKLQSIFQANPKDSRRSRGAWAERYAALRMRLRGYHTLERNLITPYAEIDLLLGRRNQLILLEVKYRNSRPDVLVHKKQRLRLLRAAHWVYMQSPRTQIPNSLAKVNIRIDLALVLPQNKWWKLWKFYHYPNAIQLEELHRHDNYLQPEEAARFH